jgi:hypothetical protein
VSDALSVRIAPLSLLLNPTDGGNRATEWNKFPIGVKPISQQADASHY